MLAAWQRAFWRIDIVVSPTVRERVPISPRLSGEIRRAKEDGSMSEDIVTVGDRDFEHEVMQSDLPVLVDFWAEWCGPCHMVAPVVEQIAAQEKGKLRVAKLDIDVNPHTANRFGVMSIPTLILFIGGEERGRVVGARGKEHVVETLLGDLAA